jgi:hypothetical protein
MNRFISTKPLIAAAIALGGLALASGAQAHTDVRLAIGIPAPIAVVQPAPVYAAPAPVYVQPAPVYVRPAPVYRDVRYGYYEHHRWERRGPWGDADHDGVPNRYDHAPFNPHRR